MASGSTTFTKDPAEKLDYRINWEQVLEPDADSVSSSAWTVEAGITVETTSNDTASATVWLSGGTDGTTYTATNRITTSGGRIHEQPIVITVSEKE